MHNYAITATSIKEIWLQWKSMDRHVVGINEKGTRFYWLFGHLFERKSVNCSIPAQEYDVKLLYKGLSLGKTTLVNTKIDEVIYPIKIKNLQ